MTTLVYPIGRRRGDLARYSLRTLADHTTPGEVDLVVIGERPAYLDEMRIRHIPTAQGPGQFANIWAAWRAAADHLDDWWWMNDDFMIGAGLEHVLVHAHRGPLTAFCEALERRRDIGPWRKRARAAHDALEAAGYGGAMSWEAHRPMYATAGDVRRAEAFLDEAGLDGAAVAERTLISTLAGRAGEHLFDPKFNDRHGQLCGPLVSLGPAGWRGEAGRIIRGLYYEPSPWERH